MNSFVRIVAAAALICVAVPPAKAESTVRFATLTSISKAPPGVVAEAKGFFAKEGVKVEMKLFNAGRVANEGLASGNFDVGMFGDIPGLSLIGQGFPGKVIAAGLGGPARESLLVKVDSPYKKLADLKGKKIALTKGSTNEMVMEGIFAKLGMKWEDFTVVNMAPPTKATALQLGQVDAVVAWEPVPAVIVTKGIGRRVVSGEGYIDDNLGVVIASDEILKKDPQAIVKFLRALNKGAVYAQSNPDEMVDLLSKKLKVDRAILIDAIPSQWWYTEIYADTLANWQKTADFLWRNKRTKEHMTVSKVVDASYLSKATGKTYPLKQAAKDVMKYPAVTVKQ